MSTWEVFFLNGILNYIFVNRGNREIIGPYCNKIGISIIPWALFLSFIINEEEYYREMLINLDNSNLPLKYESDLVNANKVDIANDESELNDNNKLYWFMIHVDMILYFLFLNIN